MSIFIQEVLNLLQRDKSKQTLNLKTDYLEFGRKGTSTLNTGTSYAPSMDPYVIKAQDFVCSVTEGLTKTVEGEGKEFVFPIYTKTDGLCELAALKNSVMLMVGDTVTVDDSSKFHSNWIRLGDVLEAGGSVGTVGQVLTVGSEGNPVWAAGGGGGGSITGSGTTNYMTMWTGSTSIGDSPMKMIQSISSGVNILTLGTDTDFDRVTFEATAEFQGGVRDRNGQLGTAGQVLKSNVSGDVSWADLAAPITYDLTGQVSGASDFAIGLAGSDGTLDKVSLIAGTDITLTDNGSNGVTIDCAGGTSSPVMTSILTGTGKLWSDVVQVQTAAAVSNTDLRTYGVQFNDASQLVVNVPWVEGTGGSGTVTSVTSSNEVFIEATGTSPITSTGDLSFDLSASGTPSGSTFLRGDNTWATIPGGNPGTVTSVGLAMDGNAVSINGTPVTSSGVLDISWIGLASEYVNGEGNLVAFPTLTLGTVTDFSAVVNGGVTDAISLRVFDSTTTPRLELDFDGVAGQYINGLGVLTTFPTITSGTVTTVSATTTGDALDVLVTNPTTAPDLQFTWSGLSTDYIDGQGNVKVFPASSAGTVTSVATTHSGNAFAATIGNVSTINPSVDITMQGDSSQYVNGSGDLVTFPSIPTSYSWNLEGDTGTPEEIIDGENAKIGGGTGISTSTVAANTLSVGLDNTGVTAGNYSAADITVNSQGQITAASDGSAALGYLSYVAIWTNPKGQPITVTILSNDTGCQWNWELSASLAGEYTISPSVPGDPFTICDKAATHTTWVMANGQSTPVEGVAPAQIYFKNVTNQKVVIELLEESNIGSTKGVERGNIEIRLYNNIK
tara:strand:+ start:1084 stop:3603 length:2520 start_codon:yes stop_codon:yes gene_type:complete